MKIKVFYFIWLIIISSNVLSQEFDIYSNSQLDSLKNVAVNIQNFDFAQKIKDELLDRNKYIIAREEFVKNLQLAVNNEDYKLAADLKSKIELFNKLDSLEAKKKPSLI